MASLCTRCALRFHRAAPVESLSRIRTFSSTPSTNAHAIPTFTPTANPKLDDVLASMRNKHFIPAALSSAQRHLIFGHSNREDLASNPQAVEIAGERIELKWTDRRKEIPNRTKLFRQAVKLMAEDGSREAWGNLPRLLVGLRSSGVEITRMEMERLLRLAIAGGNFGVVLGCLRRGNETGMTLKRPEVLEAVLLALRKQGQADGWSQESVETAMNEGRAVAELLEMEIHGGGSRIRAGDSRQDPRVIGVYLELSAVFASKHQGGRDVDGRVRAYSDRLLSNIEGAKEIAATEPAEQGRQTAILLSIPIYHGLKLAQQVLAMEMPNAMLAEEVRNNYEHGLTALVQKLETQHPEPTKGGYAEQALLAWRECTSD